MEEKLWKIIEDIERISILENKNIFRRMSKFSEEYGEFNAELIKFDGFTYKEPDKEHLTEEAADAWQVLTSIVLQVLREYGITKEEFFTILEKKSIKWESKIKEYRNNEADNNGTNS